MPELRADLVDADALVIVLPDMLGLSAAERQDGDIARRLGELEQEIETARLTGRLIRYKRTLESSGTVVGSAYKRAELERFVRANRVTGLLQGELRNRSQRRSDAVQVAPLKPQIRA